MSTYHQLDDSLAYIRQFCSQHGLKLNTDLGQHFLIDRSVLEKIIHAANIQPDDHILEIGPGIGVLTKELLAHAKHVTAIELDERMIWLLKKFTGNPSHLTLDIGNALRAEFPKDEYKIVANIPYHITSPLLRKAFLESKRQPTSLTLLIQREVAEKICPPERSRSDRAGDTKNGSILSIIVGLFGTPEIITKVPPAAFLPPPKVDSAVIHIESFPKPLASPEIIEEVFRLTKIAFSQKRKMLRNTFGSFPDGLELLKSADIDPSRRPQALTIAEWISLATLRLKNGEHAAS